jgi:hypothetical protein
MHVPVELQWPARAALRHRHVITHAHAPVLASVYCMHAAPCQPVTNLSHVTPAPFGLPQPATSVLVRQTSGTEFDDATLLYCWHCPALTHASEPHCTGPLTTRDQRDRTRTRTRARTRPMP